MVEDILMDLAKVYPEAKLAAERFIIQARLGILQEGAGSYANLMGDDSRIHGKVIHIGTVTHRCAHRSPNLGNPTSVRKPYGLDMRRLFTAVPGYRMAGTDASGLELRMLAHYLAKWDGGVYASVVDGGDVHSLHRDAINAYTNFGVDRDQTKTIGYAWLYGAGDAKLGSIVGKGPGAGKKIREALRTRIQGMDPLLAGLEHKLSTTGSITSLDRRRVGIRHKHAVLNSLLQTAGAVVMRWFLYYLERNCENRRIGWWSKYIPHLYVHDEIQGSLKPGLESEFELAVTAAFGDTRAALNLRVPLKGEIKYGNNWAETH
jgi:DNA polymerase I-like protein with 3'-5' exonuclease and polymerase domains